jgi:hypothetical protein
MHIPTQIHIFNDGQGDMEIKDRLSLLHFAHEQEWLSLSGWASFFLGLGESLADISIENNRYAVALALPTRSYATALLGSGFSYANLLHHSYEDAEYLEYIYSLPEGTSIKFYDNGKVIKAIKKDVLEYNGKLHIGIQIEGTATKYILPQNAHKIEIVDRDYERLPNKQMGRSVIPPSELLLELLTDKASEFVYRTRIDGIVVGIKNTLSEEAQLPLAISIKDKRRMREGRLSDLFRIEGFNPRNVGHRYILHSSNSKSGVPSTSDLTPDAPVLFDGALGFLKWREMYRHCHWVVFLDHTDINFQNAVSEINREYINRSDAVINHSLPPLPNGIEMMFFARDT